MLLTKISQKRIIYNFRHFFTAATLTASCLQQTLTKKLMIYFENKQDHLFTLVSSSVLCCVADYWNYLKIDSIFLMARR